MSKLLSVLIAGFFAVGAIAQNVYGPGANRLARQQQGSGGTGISMMPGQGHGTVGSGSGTNSAGGSAGDSGTPGGSVASGSGSHACPPGLAKKDNGCLPPGQARKGTSTMGNTGSGSAGHTGGATAGTGGTTGTPK